MPSRFESTVADALQAAVDFVGLHADSADDERMDFVLSNPAGGQLVIELKRMSLVSVHGLADRLDVWSRQLPDDVIGVLVADRITQDARSLLNAAGWGWLDLRGHLRIVGRGLFIDTDVPAVAQLSNPADPFSGQVGMEVAAALLLEPDRKPAVRSLATELGRAPSSVSDVLARMRTAHLIDDDGKPVVPQLFWELAAHWQVSSVDVSALPADDDQAMRNVLRIGFDDVEHTTGWALGDSVAAAAYGAPIAIRSDHPRDFAVPDGTVLRRASRLLGPAAHHESRGATIRVAPVPMVCTRRVDGTQWAHEEWPLAQPLFVALDLAQDPGRGREILADWTPQGRWHRVW